MFLDNICRTCLSYLIFFEWINFVLSYSTHIWNAYIAANLLKIKKEKKKKHACNKDKTHSIIFFHELKSTLKIGYNWLHIWGVMKVFRFSAAEGARKLMKPKHIFVCPGKTELQKSTPFSLSC